MPGFGNTAVSHHPLNKALLCKNGAVQNTQRMTKQENRKAIEDAKDVPVIKDALEVRSPTPKPNSVANA